MGGAEEVPAGTDFLHRLEAERLGVDDDRLQEGLDHAQQFGVEDHLLVARVEAALHPAGAMHEQVHSTHQRTPQGEDGFVCGLSIKGVRSANAALAAISRITNPIAA